MNYTEDMCARSLDLLRRTVNVANHPDRTDEQVAERIEKIKAAVKNLPGKPATT